jgi:hypothetical protein
VVTNAFNVSISFIPNTPTPWFDLVVNCPSGTSVLSNFIYRVPGGVRHPFPPNVDVTGWPNSADRAQWNFRIRNANNFAYSDPVEAGVVCATTN